MAEAAKWLAGEVSEDTDFIKDLNRLRLGRDLNNEDTDWISQKTSGHFFYYYTYRAFCKTKQKNTRACVQQHGTKYQLRNTVT